MLLSCTNYFILVSLVFFFYQHGHHSTLLSLSADYDFGKHSDFLGYARLPLCDIITEKELQSKWLEKAQLERWTKQSQGQGQGQGQFMNSTFQMQTMSYFY